MTDNDKKKLEKAEHLIQNEYNRQHNKLKQEEISDFESHWERLDCEKCGENTFIPFEQS